jgi:hypothetical protein
MTHDLLEDLVRDVPRQIAPDVRSAWRAGTARRRRRYTACVAAAAVLGVGASVGVLGFDPPRRADPVDGGGTGYPSEVPKPIGLTDLPDKPGLMAGLMGLDGLSEWVVIDSAGHSWRLPEVSPWGGEVPALSDDGRMLGYLVQKTEDRSEYVVVDLVTGARTGFPDVGDGRSYDDDMLTEQTYFESGQTPQLWSPDNHWLAVQGAAVEDSKPGPLLLGVDGEVREIGVGSWPVGWLAPDRLAILDGGVTLKTVDPTGVVLERVDLAIPRGFKVFGQWSGRLSRDGSKVAVVAEEKVDRDPESRLFVFDSRTGALLDDLAWRDGLSDTCLIAWKGDRVLAWAYGGGLIDVANGETLVEPAGQWGETSCGMFSVDALAGPAQPGPDVMEWRYWEVLWLWRQLLGALVAVLVGSGLVWFARHRRLEG